MRKICIINQKGGVGKTTTAINLAFGLAAEGRRVLMIDLDGQGNLAKYLGIESDKDLFDLLIENAEIQECTRHVAHQVDLIPSRETLAKAELMIAGEPGREYFLKKKLKELKGYDYVIIDCPPGLSLLNQNAMVYCGEAIIPASTDVLGFDALRKMIKVVQTINEVFDHDLTVSKVVPTMHDTRTKLSKSILNDMQSEFYTLISDPIRMNSKIREGAKKHKPLIKYARSSNGGKDYTKLVKNILHDEKKFGLTPIIEMNGKKAEEQEA
jgi:chromosome partitioning protein